MATVEELEAMIAPLTWYDFEIAVGHQINRPPFEFKLRWGLVFNKPSKVIMADGKFVRVKPYAYDFPQLLTNLDPQTPDASNLYYPPKLHRWSINFSGYKVINYAGNFGPSPNGQT